MPRMRVVSVRIEHVDHETGLWCNTCMLPTGIRCWVAVTIAERMHLRQWVWRFEHEGSQGVETP